MALNEKSLDQRVCSVKGELIRVELDKPLYNECIHKAFHAK